MRLRSCRTRSAPFPPDDIRLSDCCGPQSSSTLRAPDFSIMSASPGNPLVAFLLLSEFDIDKGSTLRHVLPHPLLGFDDNRLAELMLPDGAHLREADSTAFMLRPSKGVASPAGASSDVLDGSRPTTPSLLRCISVAKTRMDAGRRRHADLKALALVSASPFIDTLRPALALALEAYFSEPTLLTLERILAAFNSLDTASFTLPSASERAVLRALLPLQGKSVSFLFPPPLSALLSHRPAAIGDHRLAGAADAATLGAAAAPASSDATAPAAPAISEDHWFWSPRLPFQPLAGGPSLEVAFRFPRFLEPAVFHTALVSNLLRRFGEGLVDIVNAVLLERRVLFLGSRGVSAAEVCNAVLACSHLVCPPLSDSALLTRMYPYANLNDLSFLETPGWVRVPLARADERLGSCTTSTLQLVSAVAHARLAVYTYAIVRVSCMTRAAL